jgi:hypothetical protein
MHVHEEPFGEASKSRRHAEEGRSPQEAEAYNDAVDLSSAHECVLVKLHPMLLRCMVELIEVLR